MRAIALRVKEVEIPALPQLPDPVWNQAIESISQPFRRTDEPYDEAMEPYVANWTCLAWFFVLNRPISLLPRGFKVPAVARRWATMQAKIGGEYLILLEQICNECHPASTYGGADYRNHVEWFEALVIEEQRINWEGVKRLEGSRRIADKQRSFRKSLNGHPIENPCLPDEMPHFYNLIEVCRFKLANEAGFAALWERYLKTMRVSKVIEEGTRALLSDNGKRSISSGSGKGVIAF